MIKTFFAALLLLSSVQVFARSGAPSIKDVASIWPYEATAKQVQEKLGKPDKEENGHGQAIWYYKDNGSSLVITWDVKATRVMKYAFTSKAGKDDEWSAKEAKSFVTGETTIHNIIDLLGTPNDLAVDQNVQQMQYTYKNDVVQLRFIDGKLKEYVVRSRA